jgi:hypothetical protein
LFAGLETPLPVNGMKPRGTECRRAASGATPGRRRRIAGRRRGRVISSTSATTGRWPSWRRLPPTPTEIGVHTVTHRALPPSQMMRARPRSGCHGWLRDLLAAPLPILAIPYGLGVTARCRSRGEPGWGRCPYRPTQRHASVGRVPAAILDVGAAGGLGAAMLGVYEWAHALGLKRGTGDPSLSVRLGPGDS